MYSKVAHESCTGPRHTCIPGDPTLNPTQLDHFITSCNNVECVRQCFVHEDNSLNMSDHYPITISLKCADKPTAVNI